MGECYNSFIMNEVRTCRTCGSKLVIRETQKKPSQLKKAYYYKAYFYCPKCQKIYHDDIFKVENAFQPPLAPQPHLPSPSQGRKGENDITPPLTRGGREGFSPDVEIWTDGACVFNGQHNARAAWSFVSGKIEEAGLVPGSKQTNNMAEGLAILKALEWAAGNNFKKIKLYTDSQISIHNLKKPAIQIKANRELFQKIEDVINQNKLKVYYEKVLGHSGDINNERADRLANELASLK